MHHGKQGPLLPRKSPDVRIMTSIVYNIYAHVIVEVVTATYVRTCISQDTAAAIMVQHGTPLYSTVN